MTLILVPKEGLTTRNNCLKYESSITYHSKVTANVKVLCRRPDKQTNQTERGKNLFDMGHINKHKTQFEIFYRTFH